MGSSYADYYSGNGDGAGNKPSNPYIKPQLPQSALQPAIVPPYSSTLGPEALALIANGNYGYGKPQSGFQVGQKVGVRSSNPFSAFINGMQSGSQMGDVGSFPFGGMFGGMFGQKPKVSFALAKHNNPSLFPEERPPQIGLTFEQYKQMFNRGGNTSESEYRRFLQDNPKFQSSGQPGVRAGLF